MPHHGQEIKDKVKSLRLIEGLSLGKIQKLTNVPKTTIGTWVADASLTNKQIEKIKVDSLILLQKGRVRAQKANKEKRLTKEKKLLSRGISEIGQLNNRELMIAGIALYWAEGFKNIHEHRLGFCNSDPRMIKFYLYWLRSFLNVEDKDLVARLTLNESYQNKIKPIEQYWSEITGIPLNQFSKPFYQRTQWKKQYNTDNYHGVLRIHVKNTLDDFLKMRGWIEGLKLNLPG